MPWGGPQASCVVLGLDRGRTEKSSLLVGQFNPFPLAHSRFDTLQRQTHSRGDLLAPVYTHHLVQTRNLVKQRALVTLRQASRGHHSPQLPVFFKFHQLAKNTQAFQASRLNEAAGVHHHHIRVRGVRDDLVASHHQLAQHAFRIDGIFGTTQADKCQTRTWRRFLVQFMLQDRLALTGRFGTFSFSASHVTVPVGKKFNIV